MINGFGLQDVPDKTIYEYDDIRGESHAIKVANINPYYSSCARCSFKQTKYDNM
jgi:hypothetical protein